MPIYRRELRFCKAKSASIGRHRATTKPFLRKAFTEKKALGQGWEVVERYISGQKGYEKADTVSVMDEEKEKTHKTGYITLYNKLFGGKYQK